MSRPVWLMRKLIIMHTARAFAVTNVANCSSSRFRRFLLQTLTTKSSTSRILKVVYTSQPVLQPVVQPVVEPVLQPVVGLQPASRNVWNIYIINKYFFLISIKRVTSSPVHTTALLRVNGARGGIPVRVWGVK